MQLIATPTLPLEIPTGSMLDIPGLPDFYATLQDAIVTDAAVLLIVLHDGALITIAAPIDHPVSVISYGMSNALESK